MTSPFKQASTQPITKTNWLGRLLSVESDFEDKLHVALSDAAKDVDSRLEKIKDDGKISSGIHRVQLRLARTQIGSVITDLFGTVLGFVKTGKEDAAVAAVDAATYHENNYLIALLPDKTRRNQYISSLHQTARRNVEALETRLGISEIPLSERVYNTKALATGQVNRAINNGLARGASAKQIADDVTGLINPRVPGGVSASAMRLGRTELNNTFHSQSIVDAQEQPWVTEMRWNLSKQHKVSDECDLYAITGLFHKDHVPNKPHPNCYCYVTPELMDYEVFEHQLLIGTFNPYIDRIIEAGHS